MADCRVQIGDLGQDAGAQALGPAATMGVSLGVVRDLGGALRFLGGFDLGVDGLALFQAGGVGLTRSLGGGLSGGLGLLARRLPCCLQLGFLGDQERTLGGVQRIDRQRHLALDRLVRQRSEVDIVAVLDFLDGLVERLLLRHALGLHGLGAGVEIIDQPGDLIDLRLGGGWFAVCPVAGLDQKVVEVDAVRVEWRRRLVLEVDDFGGHARNPSPASSASARCTSRAAISAAMASISFWRRPSRCSRTSLA
ncbi:hypothetical protein D3C86_1396530 [compost metagenome]